MIKGINHIGIAVRSIEKALKFYRDTLGLSVARVETVESEGVRIAFLSVGNTRLELLEPIHEQSPVFKFLQTHGEGIHHLAFETENIGQALDTLSQQDCRMIGNPKSGADDMLISFIHPKSAHGVLVELCQPKNP